MALRSVHLRIKGLVQGVSYRASARDEALRSGLTGWVRNLPNGDVEAFAQGPTTAVAAFVAWCRTGPDEARVSEVEVTEAAAAPFVGFEVRR